jgi:hypothetical protein
MLFTAGGRGRDRRNAYTSASCSSAMTFAVYGGICPRGAHPLTGALVADGRTATGLA